MSIFFKRGKRKPIKYPCRKCVYYCACGDGGRTKACEDRKTKADIRDEERRKRDE